MEAAGRRCRLLPPLCAACGRSCRREAVLCTRCARRLAAAEPLLGMGAGRARPGLVLGAPRGRRSQPRRRAQVPALAAGRRPDGRPDPVARTGSHAERRRGAGADRRRPAFAAAVSIPPVSSPAPSRSGSRPRLSVACAGAGADARSGAAGRSGSGTRRESRPVARRPAAFSSSTTSSPPAPRSPPAPKRCGPPERPALSPLRSPGASERQGCSSAGRPRIWSTSFRVRERLRRRSRCFLTWRCTSSASSRTEWIISGEVSRARRVTPFR